MNPWDICKLILLTPIFFPGRNPTICKTHGHKGYTGVEVGSRHIHRHKGPPGQGNRPNTSRGTHYGPRRFHQKFESATDTSDYFPARPPESDYYQYGEGGKHKSPQRTITIHGTPIDIDITNKRSTNEVKYYRDEDNGNDVFTARDNFLISRVFKGEKVIWKAKDGNYPVMVSVSVNQRGKPKLTVFYPRDAIETRSKPNVTTPITSHSDQGDRCLEQSDDPELVILDISLRDTFEYEYRWNKRDHLDVFTANYPFAFHSIVKGDRVLWRAKGGLYPVKVTVGVNQLGRPRITVFYPREHMYTPPTPLPRVRAPGTALREPTADKVEPTVTPVELDIETDRVTTKSYYYLEDDSINIATYTCKDGYGIGTVKQLDKDIWNAYTNYEYANMVLVETTGKGKKTVTIRFDNGTKKVFNKAGRGKPWTELKSKGPQPLDPSQHPGEVKIITKGSSTENDTDKYKVYVEEYKYKFNPGSKCTCITHLGKEVWKYDSTTSSISDLYPESILYNHTKNMFTINFDSGSAFYKLDTSTGSWKPEEGIDLDTDVNTSTKKYDYSKERGGSTYIYSFVAKEGEGFKTVRNRNNVLWTANNVLAKRVVIHQGSPYSYTALIFGGGKFQVYYDSDKRAIKYSLTELKFYAKENGIQELVPTHKYEDDMLTSYFSYGFKFKDNVKVTEIKYGDISLKTYDKYYPSGVYLDLITNTFFAMVGDNKEDLDCSKIPKKESWNKTGTLAG